jgi:hypothetical protein
MFTWRALRYDILQCEKNKCVHWKACKSKLHAYRPAHANYFAYKNDGDKNKSCCAANGRKLFTLPGVTDTYSFLMSTWSTLPESYQQMLYRNTLPSVRCQIRQVENPPLAMLICMEEACVDNTVLQDYLTSEVGMRSQKSEGITQTVV